MAKEKNLYSEEVASEILDRISEGETLRALLRTDPDRLPGWRDVHRWINGGYGAPPDFAKRYGVARAMGADAIAQSLLDMIDAEPDRLPDGRIDNGWVQLQKLRTEQRLKLLAKWDPKRYGDRLGVDHGVSEGSPLDKLIQQIQGSTLSVKEGGES